jgi:catechol 2,3-dioxygenase-like lactoylglutathione lyase family enzyme
MARRTAQALVAAAAVMAAGPTAAARAADTDFHHVHITTSSPSEGVRWYVEQFGCKPIADRSDSALCGRVELIFVVQPAMGSTQGTGVNHIAFSYADLAAKMAALEKVGVQGSGVRLQRFDDGSMIREVAGLFPHSFVFDPWGTRIELVQDPDLIGFHHVHLSATNPDTTLNFYRNMLGGQPASLKGRQPGLRFGELWLLVSRHEEGSPASTKGRSVDHVAFVAKDFDKAIADLQQRKAAFLEQPGVPPNARTQAKHVLLDAPDGVRIEVVEAGFAGVRSERTPAAVTTDSNAPYTAPKTPWGEPDLQGIYSSNSAHSIPLERPKDKADVKALTADEAAARRERGTLGSIWGYEREWRDVTLEYQKRAPSTQVAMVIDPPDGRIPPMTESARKRAEEAARRASAGDENVSGSDLERLPGGPEDLGTYVRCITRGLPGMMMPAIYNNGLQIIQGPGYVAIENEMIHETRIIPTTPRERRGANLATWLGDPQGRWEGDSLIVETSNFNGRMPYRGATTRMKLTERFTRIAPGVLEYRFTIDDPATWTRPWTGMFTLDKDDDQYELVEYACHEANYGMTNILSGARATEKAREAAKKK